MRNVLAGRNRAETVARFTNVSPISFAFGRIVVNAVSYVFRARLGLDTPTKLSKKRRWQRAENETWTKSRRERLLSAASSKSSNNTVHTPSLRSFIGCHYFFRFLSVLRELGSKTYWCILAGCVATTYSMEDRFLGQNKKERASADVNVAVSPAPPPP